MNEDLKRKLSESDTDDEIVGPSISDSIQKKKKVLEHEKIYLENLPNVEYYEKSYMHRDVITHCLVTKTNFLITASCDGHLKFWKKVEEGIEFVKHFRAHLEAIVNITGNSSGKLLATISLDKHTKIFDIINFDMINIIKLDFVPGYAEWIHSANEPISTLAISESNSPKIHIYNAHGKNELLHTIEKMHQKTIVIMKFNPIYECTVSVDSAGILEYWQGMRYDYKFPKCVRFESKLDTDLFEFVKAKTYPTSIAFTPDGKKFATISVDRKVRIFVFLTGKLIKVLDETIPRFIEAQHAQQQIPSIEFNKKMATEKDLERSDVMKYINIIFDESGYFILYPTMLGVKIVNIFTNRCITMLGKTEHIRPLNIALFQGKGTKLKMGSSSIPYEIEMVLNSAPDYGVADPSLFCTAHKKNRFYIFSRRDPSEDVNQEGAERDVFNEKPTKEDIIVSTEGLVSQKLYENAIIHSTFGDIHIKLFMNDCPKTVENFCGHSKNGYYNGHLFHRVIKSFMIQTGDPTGNGTGGQSIWGGEFEDEFRSHLKHDKPYTVSMANAGPNTNGSQFFITVIPTPWLDNKHTVFGRVTKGMEVVQNISNVRTNPKTDKPYDEISIISITLK